VPPMKARILLLSTSLGMGGADRQIVYLTRALLDHGYDVRVVSMTPLEEMGRQAVSEGLPVTSLDMQRGRADWRSFRHLVDQLQSWHPHLLTTFMYHANIMGRLAAKWAGVPLVVTSVRSERIGGVWRDWAMRLTRWMDHCHSTNSHQVAESMCKRGLLSRHKLRVIPNGIDADALQATADEAARVRAELGVRSSEFAWLAVGRLLPQKDYPTLLQAFAPLAQRPTRLLIAGRGPLLDELQQQAERLGVASRVMFLGVRHDIAALLAAADCFVLSSAWEGMPNVVMEAMAAARPVVSTHVGGVAELVQAGTSGLLVSPRDPGALSQAMRHMMSLSEEERKEMGRSGRDHIVSHYTMGTMVNRWMTLYRELLTRRDAIASSTITSPE
jgi:glycosyltransferase involved in cell wall biosynthesis